MSCLSFFWHVCKSVPGAPLRTLQQHTCSPLLLLDHCAFEDVSHFDPSQLLSSPEKPKAQRIRSQAKIMLPFTNILLVGH